MHVIISKWLRRQQCRQKRKTMGQEEIEAKKRNCPPKRFHSFKYVIDHANVPFFFSVDCFCYCVWFLLYSLMYLLRTLCRSHKFIATQIFYLNTICIYEFFKNHPRKGVFHNVNLSYLVNVLQRNLSTRRAGECIFRPSGGTNYENFPVQRQPWWRLPEFDLCNDLPKKLWIHHCQVC